MRSSRFSVWDPIALLSLAAAAAATWSVFERLPDPIPTHFDMHGNPNGWMPRAYGAWFVPAFGFLMWFIVRFAPVLLPRKDKQNLKTGLVALTAMLTTVFLAAVHVVVLYVVLNPGANITQIVLVMTGFLFAILGLIMPRVKRNPMIGIRTKWTLESDENWARTHRVAGYSMVIAGIFAGLGGLVGGLPGTGIALVALMGGTIVPAVWSLMYARRQDPS